MRSRIWIPAIAGLFVTGVMPLASAQQTPVQPGERTRQEVQQQRDGRADERAAERQQDRRQQNRDQAVEGRKFENMDQLMVAWLTPGNEEEIILAHMALERSQNEQVRQFAQQMIDEHGKFLKDLGRFGTVNYTFDQTEQILGAAGQRQDGRAADARRDDRPAAERRPNRPADRTADRAADRPADRRADDADRPGPVREAARDFGEAARDVAQGIGDTVRGAFGFNDARDACQIKEEIHRECLALTQRELDKRQGEEFDQAYLGHQTVAHIGMLATLKTFERHASDEMRPLIQQGVATAEQHLRHAEELKTQLGRAATARRPADAQPQ